MTRPLYAISIDDTEIAYDPRQFKELLYRARIGHEARYIAMYWADKYASHRTGRRVFPGMARMQVELEVGVKFIRKGIKALVAAGFAELVKSGRGRGSQNADEYRLCIPLDLLDRVDVPSPDAMVRLIDAKQASKQGRTKTASVTPLECPERPQTSYPQVPRLEAPERPQTVENPEPLECPERPQTAPLGTPQDVIGDARASYNNPLPQPLQPTPETRGCSVRTYGSVVGAFKGASKNPKCVHGLAPGLDDTGRPRCAFCRRGDVT